MTRVSVIIPCYNRQDLLPLTLNSLRAQTYHYWETIVVDDRSEDNSYAVAQTYATKDERFRPLLRQGDLKGANVCRNQGLAAAAGEYVIFLDSDDLLVETCLERRVAEMDESTGCGFGVYQTELFAERVGDRRVLWNAYTSTPDLHRFLSKDVVWHTTGPIWRKEVPVKLGGFDVNLLSFQDWEFHVRALISRINYYKSAVRDHFYRNGSSSRFALSSVSYHLPDHLKSHERMFVETLARLETAGLLDDALRCRAGGLFWWLAERWHHTDRTADADRVWRKAYELRLCSRSHFLQGLLILRLFNMRGGGRLASLIQKFWPKPLHQTGSNYFLNAPMAGAVSSAGRIPAMSRQLATSNSTH